jgi:virulence factor
METVSVGVVGAGQIARLGHLPSLEAAVATGTARIVGVVDPVEALAARAAARFEGCRAYASVGELLRAGAPAAVFILTPKDTHADLIRTCLAAGADVLSEKPLATRLADASELVALAERAGRLLMVGFNRRYAPVYVRAKEAFGDRRPRVCIAHKYRPEPEYRSTLENGIHVLDLMRWFCGEADTIEAAAQYDDPFHEISVVAQIRFDGGALGSFVSQREAGRWSERVELVGRGLTVLVDAPDTVRIAAGSDECARRMAPLAPMGAAEVHHTWGFQAEVAEFLRCVRTREVPRTAGADALKTHELLDRILRAAGLPPLGTATGG